MDCSQPQCIVVETTVCFQAFDNDNSGVIDEEEFIELCATVNNMNPTYPGNFMRAMSEFDKYVPTEHHVNEFCIHTLTMDVNIIAMHNTHSVSDTSYLNPRNDDGMIDFEEFQLLNRRYPSVLFPIFRLQDLLQKSTLGTIWMVSLLAPALSLLNCWISVLGCVTGEKAWLKVAARNSAEKRAERYKKLHNGQLPPMSLGSKMKRKLCCCLVKEPRPGTWAEVRQRIHTEHESKRKKGKKGKKGKTDKGGGKGKKYH